MHKLHNHVGSRIRKSTNAPIVPVSKKIRPDQVENHAGGQVFALTPLDALDRFLVLGTEGGTFYASERKATLEAVASLDAALAFNHKGAVDLIVKRSQNAPKMNPILFSYARSCSVGEANERSYALSKLQSVCRTGTHLFNFMEFVASQRGFGRGLRNAVAAWYTAKNPIDVAFQVTKYGQRDGWSHGDVLRLAHPKSGDKDLNYIFQYALWKDGFKNASKPRFKRAFADSKNITPQEYISLVEKIKGMDDAREIAKYVVDYRLPREVLPTECLNSPVVWDAMLAAGMPMTALIRNLGNLSKVGLLTKTDKHVVDMVCDQLTSVEALRGGRIHPLTLFVAKLTYEQGHGMKGGNTWVPVPKVVDALEEAFYKAFDFVPPSNDRLMLALDVSGSMSWGDIAGMPLTPRVGAAIMAMVQLRANQNSEVYAFSDTLQRAFIDPSMKLAQVHKVLDSIPMGGTDCSLPARYARGVHEFYDGFVIYTDCETWAGGHPFKELEAYRKSINPRAKQVVVGMQSNGFTIADPNDPLSLDVVGFAVDTPQVIQLFMEK